MRSPAPPGDELYSRVYLPARRLGPAAALLLAGVGAAYWLTPGPALWPERVLFTAGWLGFAGLTTWGLLRPPAAANVVAGILAVLGALAALLTWLHPAPPTAYLTAIPFAGALLLFGRWTALGIGAILVVSQGAIIALRATIQDRGPVVLLGLVIGLFVIEIVELSRQEARARRQAEALLRDLHAAHQALRQYAQQAEQWAAQRERTLLAREIHDGLGHYLTAAGVQAQAAHAYLARDPARASTALAAVEELIAEALAEVRRSVQVLRADEEPALAAGTAIRRLVAAFEAEGRARVFCTVYGDEAALPPAVALALYRAAQEALTNIRKHAGAVRQVHLAVDLAPPVTHLRVYDDGAGFDPAQAGPRPAGSGFGLRSLRERLAPLNGTLTVTSTPGAGTTVEVAIPLDEGSGLGARGSGD